MAQQGAITFTLPSSGEVTSNANIPSIIIKNHGEGECIRCYQDNTNATNTAAAILGRSENGYGIYGTSGAADGIHGETSSTQHAGVSGINQSSQGGFGIYGKGVIAGHFEGDVEITGQIRHGGNYQVDLRVTGDIQLINAQDCAEEFDLSATGIIDPGTVMILNQSGNLEQSHQSYDKKVAGIVSGAGNLKPGLLLDKRTTGNKRVPIALMGKVYCKVDATSSPIEIGDLPPFIIFIIRTLASHFR